MPTPLPQEHQLPLEMLFSNEEIVTHCQPSPMLRQFLESLLARNIKDRMMLEYATNYHQPLIAVQEEAYNRARRELLHELLNLEVAYPVTPRLNQE